MAGSGGDPRQRLLVGRGRVAQRHPMAGGDQRLRQVEAAVELDRHRDDADVAPVRLDHPQHVGAGEARPASPDSASASPVRAETGRPAQAVEGLGAAEIRVDEVALEVGRQDARVRPGRGAGPAHALDQAFEHGGRTGDGGRAERRHAIADQPPGDLLDRVRRVERVEALDAVDVDVDEPGDEGVAVQIDEAAGAPRRTGTGRARPVSISVTRPSSTITVPGDRTRSGSTTSAPLRISGRAKDDPGVTPGSVAPWCKSRCIRRASRRRVPMHSPPARQYHSRRQPPVDPVTLSALAVAGPRPGRGRAGPRGVAQGPPGGLRRGVPGQPPERRQPPVPDAGHRHAAQRRPLHAAVDREARALDPHRARVVGAASTPG